MIVVKKDCGRYFEIYSDQNKKIIEKPKNTLYNNSEDEPTCVDKRRYNNGDYIESNIDCDIIEE